MRNAKLESRMARELSPKGYADRKKSIRQRIKNTEVRVRAASVAARKRRENKPTTT